MQQPLSHEFNSDTLGLAMALMEKFVVLSTAQEPKSKMNEALLVAQDLARSVSLLESVERRHDDLAMAKSRASTLDAILSAALNLCMNLSPITDAAGDALDDARDCSRAVVRSLDNAEAIILTAESRIGANERELFHANLIYEIVGQADRVLNFRETRLGPGVIHREIHFPPEYFEAGMSILANFANIIQARHGADGASVRIVQDGLKVKLTIDAPHHKEEIEETMEAYGRAVNDLDVTAMEKFSPSEKLLLARARHVASLQTNSDSQMVELLQRQIELNGRTIDHFAASVAALNSTMQQAFQANGVIAAKAIDSLDSSRAASHETATRALDLAISVQLSREDISLISSELIRGGVISDPHDVEMLSNIARIPEGLESEDKLAGDEDALHGALSRASKKNPDGLIKFTKRVVGTLASEGAAQWLGVVVRTLMGLS